MKLTIRIRKFFLLPAFLAFIFLPKFSFAQTFYGVSANPADGGSLLTATITITPPASMLDGDLVVIYAQYRGTGITLTVSTTGGQSWTTENANNGGTQNTRIFWCRFNGTWAANPVVSGGNGSTPFSAIMYVYRPTNSSDSWGIHVAQSNSSVTSTTVSISGLTTTVPNTVTMAFWGSPASNTWGTLSGAGWSKTGLSNQYRNVAGSGQSHTAAYNILSSAGSVPAVSQVQSSSISTRTSIICWYEYIPPPPNDDCSGVISLTPALTCTNTSGNFYGATVSASPTITGSCAGSVVYDMWYSFVAPSANVTINMSNVGTDITSPGIELLTGSCASMYSMACGTSSIAASGLIPSNTYYVRTYSNGGSAPTSSTNADFDLCITYSAPPPPPNDECSGAINLPVNSGCSNTVGTVNSATASSGIPTSCTGPAAYDVWYKFTAVDVNETITTSSFGAGFGGTRRMELYSGSCGSLTSLGCGTTSVTSSSLTVGNTYYVRIYTTTGPAPTAFGDFKICITTTASTPPRVGNSYVNISKNTTGGVVQNGDTLEVRMTIIVSAGTVYKTRYLDNVPAHTTMLSGSGDSIRVITNEGLTYRRYTATDNSNDDEGTYKSAPPPGEYSVRLNLGYGSGNWPSAPGNNSVTDITGAGNLPNSGHPKGGGGIMFATSFRVVVTGNVGDTITLNGGQFIYRTSAGGSDIVLSGSPYKILITDPLTLCTNAVGVNNASEYGGTFGSGSTLNRSTDLSFPIAGYSFVAASSTQAIGDGQYAIVNNTSPISGTNPNAYRKPTCPSPAAPDLLCTNRMFGGYWYIKGDHSGTNNAAGNAPAASGSPGGYLLAVNADYVASEAYRQTLTGLCPNTYYEFSAWLQNICPVCGIDSLGQQFAGTATAPANGYPGVYPNLTFSMDGLDRYSSGRIDTVGWVKKGFVFQTGPTQTTATLSIRNNAQGGGGNDWVLDDISIATCFPSMSYSPTSNPIVCANNNILIGDTVRSLYNNYTYYVWQRSQDLGTTWTDITSVQSASPTFNGSQWEYISTYDVPPSATNLSDSGDIYRVYTATTLANITDLNCVANDGSAPISLSVYDCGPPLSVDLLSFSGKVNNGNADLIWVTSEEDEPVTYNIDKSRNGVDFYTIGSVNGHGNSSENNYYQFTDLTLVAGKVWYRIAIINKDGKKKYSRIISLSDKTIEFGFNNVINPFNHEIDFGVSVPENARIDATLINLAGKPVRKESFSVYAGTNSLIISDTENLPAGMYILQIKDNEKIISKKLMKK